MDMQDIHFFNSFRTIISYGRGSGLPLPMKGGVLMQFYDGFIGACLAYKLVCTSYAIINIDKFEVRVYLLSALMFFFSGLFLLLFFATRGRRFCCLIERVDKLTERLVESGLGKPDLLLRHYHAASSGITSYAKVMAVLSFLCPFCFCLSVPIIDYLQGVYRTRTAVPAQCPVELQVQHIPGVYEAIVIQQALAYVVPCFQRYITECIMLGLFKIQAAYLRYLSRTLKDIGDDMVIGGNGMSEKFITWIKLHQQVLANGRELGAFFSPVIVMYYLSTIVTISGSLLYMMDAKSSNILQSLFGGGYMIMALFQLYLQCSAADEITIEGEKLAFPVYSIPWIEFDRRTKDTLRLIIKMANQPMYIDGYRSPSFRLNKVNYQALFVNTVSTFMAFRKIRASRE